MLQVLHCVVLVTFAREKKRKRKTVQADSQGHVSHYDELMSRVWPVNAYFLLNQKYLQLVLQFHCTQRKTTSMQLPWGALRISSSDSSDEGWSYRIFLITRECVTNTMILITSISKQNLQTTVITVISFRQIPGYGIDSRFGIRVYVKREQRKMLFSFQRHRDFGETK